MCEYGLYKRHMSQQTSQTVSMIYDNVTDFNFWITYSVNEELGSKRLGLFRLRDAGTPARGECLLTSEMRGEAGLTVLGDGFRDVCFDIILCDVERS